MKPVPLRILIVEHSEADARLLIETLRRGGFEPYFQCVDTETALRLALGSHRTESSAQHWDLVMANIHTPDIGALKVLEVIRESGLQVPLIAVSERADIKAALLCTQEGAYDFIRKDDSSRLFGVVARVLREAGVHGAREQSAAVLAAKDQYLAMIFDTADEGIVSVDADQRICYFNKGAEETFGYTAEEVLGRPLDILIPEGVRSIHSQHMRGFVESGEVSRKKDRRPEIRGLRKNGEIFDAEGSISKVVTPDGVLLTAILRDITSRKQAEARLHHLAYFDPLSELPNRTLFMERLEHAVIRRRDAKNNLAVLMLDLDRFKTINDSLGHKIGDQLVQELSSRLLACVRREDTVARIGGDEFAVLLESVGGSRSVFTIANKIMGSVSEPFLIKGHELFVTLSIGFSLFPTCAETAVALVQFADTALYRAKDKGRNCIEYYDKDISPKAQRKLSFENKLRRALDRDEFVLYYQPQVSLENGRVIGAEALIRWKCPGLGRVGGEDFVPLLEETGLILPVGEWVMRTAFEQIRVWQDEGLHLHVSVNLSAKQFARRDLPKKIEQALLQSRADPQYVGIEVTEGSIIQDAEKAIAALNRIKEMGVSLSIDDFGTGYSSLSYLKKMPIDTLKIDGSFIRDLPKNTASSAIVQSIIDMSHNMNMHVIAEGVETKAQLTHLMKQGCDAMQGFLFEKPLKVERIANLLRKDNCLVHLDPGLLERTLLVVGDRRQALGELKQVLGREGYHILSADRAETAFRLLEAENVLVMLLSGRMADMDTIAFLRRAKTLFPEIARIVLSPLTNFQFAADAVNHGGVYKFLAEPWEEARLLDDIRETFEYEEARRTKQRSVRVAPSP